MTKMLLAFFKWLLINKIRGSLYCAKCGACGEDGCCPATMCQGGVGCLYPYYKTEVDEGELICS